MQERLKRSSHRAGFRDVTREPLPEIADAPLPEIADVEVPAIEPPDEVEAEGAVRGLPRARLEEEEEDYEPSILGGAELERQLQERQERQRARQVSVATEPEGEVPADSPSGTAEDENFEVPTEEVCDGSVV